MFAYNQNYEFARMAIDMALGRGGDQAVIKDPEKIQYYGGKSQQLEKTTRVKARVKKDLLQLSGVTDTYVTFEYLVPYNMKRIDCILYGRNSQNQGNVVHIELKQWDNKGVRDADCEGNFNVDEDSDTTFQVQAYTGGGHRLVSHPSQQVRGYNDYLTGFIEILSSKELHIEGLAYCYNYRKNKTPNTLFDEKYSELLQAYKTYAGDEVQELAQHLQQALGNGDGETIFHKMINSPIRPSKKLLESAANLIHEGNVSAFALIEEQIIARNVILDKIRKIGNKKSIIIVKGGPGTGKTVIALHILALLAGNKKSYNIRYATKSKPLLEGVKDRLPRGSKAKLLFSNVTQFIPANCEPNNIDVLLVDEAHRISNSANNQYTPTDKRTNLTQIQTIVQAAKISVFFIDDKQAIRSVDPDKGSCFLIRVPTGAHVFDLVFSCPPTGADVGKSAIIANIGVWVLIVVNTLIIFSTELSSHGGNIKLFAAFYTNSHIRPSIHKGCLHFTIVLAKFTRRFMRRERSLPQYQPEPQGPDDLGGNANA